MSTSLEHDSALEKVLEDIALQMQRQDAGDLTYEGRPGERGYHVYRAAAYAREALKRS